MLLYKFVSEKEESSHAVLQSCVEGNLMFSRIPDLNDFSEKFASVDNREMDFSLERIIDEGCWKDEIDNLQCHINLMVKVFPENAEKYKSLIALLPMLKVCSREIINSWMDKLPRLLQMVNDEMQKRTGIFSATSTFDSFPMWAHYAGNARGFVIEYENLDQEFKGDDTGVFDVFKPIKYCEEIRDKVTFSPSGLDELFFSKLADWECEKEHRLIKVLNDCRKDESGKYFAKEKYNRYIKRVIVGWNNTHFSEIKKIVTQQSDSRIQVVRAFADVNHIQIQ